MILGALLTLLERQYRLTNNSFLFLEYLKNVWVTMKTNFGGEPGDEHEIFSLKVIILDCLLVGIVTWGAYQASLTSELAIIKLKLPFWDLETLYQSNFRLVI